MKTVGRIETKQDTSLSKQFKAKNFDKMYFFDDLTGKRKAVWVGLKNHSFMEVYKQAATSNNNNTTNSISNKVAQPIVSVNTQGGCDVFVVSAGSYECWATPGGNEYDVTCGYLLGGSIIFAVCDGSSSGSDIDFNYGAFLGTGGSGGSTTTPPSTLDSLNVFNNKITDSLHPCLNLILEKLKGIDSGKIAAIIKKFSGEAPNWNWNIIEGILPTNVNGSTSPVLNNGVVTTTLDYIKLSKATNLSVARTIMHESIHAYLVSYFRNDPINASKDYPGIVRAWSKAKNPNYNDIQHDQFIKSFIGDISAALQLFGESIGYIIDKSIYDDLAWGGLDYLNNSQLTDEEKLRISNRLNAEQFNIRYGDENTLGKKACN